MATVSIKNYFEWQGAEWFEEATRLIGLMNQGSDGGEQAILNADVMEDSDGRVWFGYNYSGSSWWITKSMSAESDPDAESFEFTAQREPTDINSWVHHS